MAIKLRTVIKHPARVEGAEGVSVEKENGVVTVGLALSDFAEIVAVDDPSATTVVLVTPAAVDGDPDVNSRITIDDFTTAVGAVNESRQVISGAGLTGGGDLSANRTLAVGAGTGITVNTDDVALDAAHARNVDHSAVSVIAGAGLTGGGTIAADRTLAVGAGTGIAVNADDVSLAAAAAYTLKGNNTAGSAVPTDINISALTFKAAPVSADHVLIQDSEASNAFKRTTAGALAVVGSVSSFNSRTGAVVPVAGDYTVALGGTGTTNLLGFMQGLQPLKQATITNIAVNPGTWANATGTAVFNTTSVLEANLTTGSIDFTPTPAVGGMLTGALSAAGATTDGIEVSLYLCHRVSDGKVALACSSSDIFGTSISFDATATTPGVIDFHTAHGLRVGHAIMLTTSGTLPAPLGIGIRYIVSGVPSASTLNVSTSLANAIAGSHLAFTTTGAGLHAARWGIQHELDLVHGVGVVTADRGFPYFSFVWNVMKFGAGTGIPNFNVPVNSTRCILTDAGDNSAYRALSAGTATSFAVVNLASFLHNVNRVVKLMCTTFGSGGSGTAYVRARGAAGAGFLVGTPASGQTTVTYIEIQTNSASQIDYLVTGSAQLTLHVIGWECSDPR